MSRRIFVVLAALFPVSASVGIAQSPPPFEGFVTRAASVNDFDVNGLHVLSNSKTTFQVTYIVHGSASTPYIGEPVSVEGDVNRGKHQMKARAIILHPEVEHKLSGFAVIDHVIKAGDSKEIVLRADGYPIRIDATTKTSFQAPLTSIASLTTNIWIAFHGILRADGFVVAEAATFTPNIIHEREDKLLAKFNYDPAAVPDSAKQNSVSKHVLGIDPKKIPPYHDAAMQARIDRIGKSLVPAYQRALPESDETKIDFHFQLIDAPKWRDALTMPSGVILVPRQIVERLPDDSQLATVLADNIATALEKQSYLVLPKNQALLAADLAGTAGGVFVPGLGILTGIATYSSGKSMQNHLLQESGRVSLSLLHDAGYDVHQAPLAWWTLAAKHPNDLTATSPPDRSLYLYKTIGEMWQATQPLAVTDIASIDSSHPNQH